MPLWNPVTAGAVDVGKLWTPDLTLSLMGRDWAQFMSPFSWYLPSTPAGGGADELLATIGVCFPDSWDGDAAYPVAARLSLTFTSAFQDAAGGWTSSCRYWLVIGGIVGPSVTVSASKATAGTVNVATTVTWDAVQGAFPTGPQSVALWDNWDTGCDTMSASRAFTDGLTSWYGCVIP